MTEHRDDHGKRRYNSTRRQAQARETRRHILEAAHRLFTTQGYVGTTMEALAREAGVAVETVYATFGSKSALLAHLVDLAVLGDDEPTPLLERQSPQEVRLETNQRRQLRLFAHDMSAIMGRVGSLWGVIRAAAPADPEIAATLRRMLASRHNNLLVFVQWLEHNGPLRAGLSSDEAADTIWALSDAAVHHLFTVDRGWTAEQFERWLADSLIALLLPPESQVPA